MSQVFTGPFPLDETMLRLKQRVPLLKVIGNAADLRTALDQKLPMASMPAAFVVRRERATTENGASGGVLIQHVNVDLFVVLHVRNHASEATGARAATDMDAVAAQVRTALLNWQPIANVVPVTFVAGNDGAYQNGTLIVQELFRSHYRIEVRP